MGTTPTTAGTGDGPSRGGSGGRTPVASAGRGGTGAVTPTPACAYREDGRCDEPEGSGLADGTDVFICTRSVRPCAYVNDGDCDEPEGTGLCDEGEAKRLRDHACGSTLCNEPDEMLGVLGSFARRAVWAVSAAACRRGAPAGITRWSADSSCSDALAPFLAGIMLEGCCRFDGLCGLKHAARHARLRATSFGMPFAAAGRIVCGGEDDLDAGGP